MPVFSATRVLLLSSMTALLTLRYPEGLAGDAETHSFDEYNHYFDACGDKKVVFEENGSRDQ